MRQGLTVKQKTFAANVAAGLPKTQAYRKAYNNNLGTKALQTEGPRTAAKPAVAREIERLTLLQLPQAEDAYALRQHARAVLVDLAKCAVSEDIRLKASMYLDSIASATIQAHVLPPGSERSDVLAELRVLYQRAMKTAPVARTLDLEAEPLTPVTATADSSPVESTVVHVEVIGDGDAQSGE